MSQPSFDLRQDDAGASPHIAYCGGSFGRVSLMAVQAVLGDHARDCVQLLVNIHTRSVPVRVDGEILAVRPFDAIVIRPRQVYALPSHSMPAGERACAGILLVKSPSPASPVAPEPASAQLRHVQRIALSRAARDDAKQLTLELMLEDPQPDVVERGVRALMEATSASDERRCTADAAFPRHGWVGREIVALHDLVAFPSIARRAAACGLSERHFSAMFRRATRLPPKAFYNMLRLEAAFRLLGDAARPVSDIAYDLGFSAPPHFTRFMRQNTGWTPTGYRSRLQRLPDCLRPRLAMTDPAGV